MRTRLLIKTLFTRDRARSATRLPHLPAEVRDQLGAREGDSLVWEQGNMQSHQRAATKEGGYFVVYVERGEVQAEVVEPEQETVGTLAPIEQVVAQRIAERGGRRA